MFNPKVPTRRVQYIRQNGSTAASTGRIQPYSKPTSWMTGPGLLSAQRVGPQSSDTAPFMVCTNPEGTHINTGAAGFGSGFDPPSGCLAPTNLEYKLQWYQTPEGTGNNGNIIANPSLSMLRDQLLYKGNQTTYNLVGDIWMFPNQVWDRFPITRENPIWCKKPRADKHTIMDPFDGSIAMDHPPGTIFIKMAKIPVPTASNADSYLNIYCTGQVSCEIVWEVERYATKNWRPERRHTALGMSLGGESNYTPTYHVDPTGAYIQPTSIGGIIGSSFFKIKRAVAPALGNKERAQKRHFYFANSNKGAKKQKKVNLNQEPQKCLTLTFKTNNLILWTHHKTPQGEEQEVLEEEETLADNSSQEQEPQPDPTQWGERLGLISSGTPNQPPIVLHCFEDLRPSDEDEGEYIGEKRQ